jgi:uncharacterized protein YndB with AHSA1/START domain
MSTNTYAKISDEAVLKATGKTWQAWIKLLDADGARKMTHQEIVALLRTKHDIGPWWQQMLTVGYEQATGKRVVHEKTGGFAISRSKTIAAPLAELYSAWNDERKRGKWLADAGFTVRKATANKSMRITWIDDETDVSVMFTAKGPDKSHIALDHERLKDARHADKMKAYWSEQLEKLKAVLEK